MLDHHYIPAFLPYINHAGMGQEYDRDKPPNKVFSEVVTGGASQYQPCL